MLYKLYIPMARGRRSGGSRGPYNPSKMGGVDGRASPSHSPTAILGGGGGVGMDRAKEERGGAKEGDHPWGDNDNKYVNVKLYSPIQGLVGAEEEVPKEVEGWVGSGHL